MAVACEQAAAQEHFDLATDRQNRQKNAMSCVLLVTNGFDQSSAKASIRKEAMGCGRV
jgi:hypothetical protein